MTNLNLTPATIAQVDRQLGNLLSGESLNLRVSASQVASVTGAVRTSYVAGFREAMIVAAMLAVWAAIVAAVWDLRPAGAGRSGRSPGAP